MNGRFLLPTPQLQKELADPAKAEQDIADGQTRIARLELRIEQLRVTGRNTVRLEELLAAFRDMLGQWNAHRREILRTIERLRTA